ncbi:sacsin-like [Asterias rubens]|uniref:sacsin-like n=1 Tax=Asterias rubens TaxID=7604 RepID=UPI0014554063|nr:sacsin-like [Asterias rubens]
MADKTSGTAFGQRVPPLYVYLKRVLEKYPEGGQILKELLQNADDAKARKVIFLHDKTEHSSDGLRSAELREFQGPALYAYNDAIFKEEDWKSIQEPEQSGKVDDVMKVGRFGLGFISVYHLTDLPSVLSGNSIGFLDPLEQNFKHGGMRWETSPEILDKYPGQFSPYLLDLFNCTDKKFRESAFKGTIFRFPFRKQPSELSKSVFNDKSRVTNLLESFRSDAEISLLFMKHVETIQVYERDHGKAPKLVFQVQIPSAKQVQVRAERNNLWAKMIKGDVTAVTDIHVEASYKDKATPISSVYVTVNTSSDTSPNLQTLIKDDDLKLRPWMGAAFKLSGAGDMDNGTEKPGRVFCFLPLPESVQSGLPVHVNGYFGLGDNRRGIKWPDSESGYDKKAQWNQLLVNEVYPEVHAKLILRAIEKCEKKADKILPKDVYRAWPKINEVKKQWKDGVMKLLNLLKDEKFVHTDGGQWMKLSEVCHHTENSGLISKVFAKTHGIPLAQLPCHVVESLDWAGIGYQEVTPAIVRNRIRDNQLDFLSRPEKRELLKYVISDDIIDDLHSLKLLPLQNGTFIFFNGTSAEVFIKTYENPSSLIPNGASNFAVDDLPDALTTSEVESHTQLRLLTSEHVGPLLRKTLPAHWINSTDRVLSWTPGTQQQPTLQWLISLWTWLTKNQVPLSFFEGIPLIYMTPNRIARLTKSSMVLKDEQGHRSLTKNICKLLETLGAVVIRDKRPTCDTHHPDLGEFIKPPTPEGVMSVLEQFNVNACAVTKKLQSMGSVVKDEFRFLMNQHDWLSCWWSSSWQIELLKNLPIFRCQQAMGIGYTTVDRCSLAVPKDFYRIPVSKLQICRLILGDDSDSLALKVGAKRESTEDFLSANILPGVETGYYDDQTKVKIMNWVLEGSYRYLAEGCKFIPTAKRGRIVSPGELFEPTTTLKTLLGEMDVFPSPAYSKGRMIQRLKEVGLKSEDDISSVDIWNIAKELSSVRAFGLADVRRGQVLLEYINSHCELLSDFVSNQPLSGLLIKLRWVPCVSSPPAAQYPCSAGWCGKSNQLYSPNSLGLFDTNLLQGSVLPLLKLPGIKDELINAFSLTVELEPTNPNNVQNVVHQLSNLSKNYNSKKDDSNVTALAVSAIYEFLNQVSGTDLKLAAEKHISTNQPLVWHGSGFAPLDKIAIDKGALGVSLVPYLHTVPTEHKEKYGSLLSSIGVRQTYQEDELCRVLTNVHQKYEREQIRQEDYKGDLTLVSNILKYIVNLEQFGHLPEILVPCRTSTQVPFCMRGASESLYVDDERLAAQLSPVDLNGVIHESISNAVAKRLGLRPLSHEIAPVDQALDRSYEIAGPSESTANAIRRNLEMYKREDVFKELIQNADDAGANEVKFLIDWRGNKNTSSDLLSENMKACHGPAIWAYNDAFFSKEDIQNICSIAAQSKKLQLDKVGRFGLGFTSVYHITDMPSVVSGPYILICDPRATHLGDRIRPQQPGIKLDLTKEEHRRTIGHYPNQFHPYNGIFGCKLDQTTESYPHTLFRLPLRTSAEVNDGKPNQLSDSSFDSQNETQPLIDLLKESAETLLLFTQNVTSVKVLELKSDNVENIETVLSVKVSRCEDKKMPRSICNPEGNLINERSILKATTNALNSPSSTTSPSTTMIVKVTREARPSKTSGKTRLNKIAKHFIISSCMSRRDQIDELASSDEGKKHGVLPCGGVAARLNFEKGGLTPKQTEGEVFSFLPLDVHTGLPFHVNGSFLLQPNRRQLWSNSSHSRGFTEGLWNERMMKDVLCQALMNLLEDLTKLSQQDIDATDFQCLWPVWENCHSDFHPLVREFYRRIRCDSVPKLFHAGTKWLSVEECFFVTDSSCKTDVRDSIVAILNTHSSSQRLFVEVNEDVVNSMEHACSNELSCRDDAFTKNTYSVDRFLREVFFPLLEKLQTEDNGCLEQNHRNKLILHVLDLRLGAENQTSYDNLLRDTECIPTSPKGEELAKPGQLVNPTEEIGQLFSEDNGRFPHGEAYRKPSHLLSLKELGMAVDDLQWEDICDCAKSICRGRNPLGRSKILLKLIGRKLLQNEEPSSEQKDVILKADLLPVLPKPDGYPSQWYSCGEEFTSASELYSSKHADILGSVQPILNEEVLGTEALDKTNKRFLGLKDKTVRVKDVIRQLETLIEQPEHNQQRTSAMVVKIYSFLQGEIVGEEGSVKKGYEAFVEELQKMRLVFCKGSFQDIKQVAFYFKSECQTYLMRVPDELSPYKTLLKLCGVRMSFGKTDFVQNLQILHEKYQESPVIEQDLETAKVLVTELSEWLGNPSNNDDITEIVSEDDEMFVLDQNNILRQTKELTFNDMPGKDHKLLDGKPLVHTHGDIPHDRAKLLGIVTVTERQVACCSSSIGFERDFGQKEKLTDRLHSILKDYPNVSDVFKELLQNADDAGSTEIHFVYDHRSHGGIGLGEAWAATQGVPALCVYNNKSFTDTDIKGIQKVGIGGKGSDVTTTGRFGIGFNAVYQLTDCPSFLTNKDKLCVFDPLLKCIPGVEESSPGRMFSTSEGFREQFHDMLTGYLEDLEEFNDKEGTLFRFPLRNSPSDISKECFKSWRVKQLLKDLKEMALEALLFLNNLQKISVSSIDEETKKLCETYTVTSSLPESELERTELTAHLQRLKDDPCDTITSKSSVYNLVIKDSKHHVQEWLVSQMLGFESPLDDAQVLSSTSSSKRPLPRGGVAAPVSKTACQLPQGISQKKYKAYCFLPLPLQTGLPVHVNGMFELDSSRSNLLKGNEFVKGDGDKTDDGFIHRWNFLLVTHVIAPAYAKLIEHAGRSLLGEKFSSHPIDQEIGIYNELFPTDLDKLQGEWKVLAKETLRYIEKNNLEVLPVVCPEEGGWTVIWHGPITEQSSAVFDNLEADDKKLQKVEQLGDDISKLRCFLQKDGMQLLKSSPELGQAFQASDVNIEYVSPAVVLKHLRRAWTPSKLADTTFSDYETFLVVLKYCLKGISDPHELDGLPFCLSNAGTLRSLSNEDSIYLTEYSKVLPSLQDKFLKDELVDLFNKWFEDKAAGTDQPEAKTENQAFSCGVFKKFNITQLAHHLGDVLPADWKGCNKYVDWTPEQNGHPSETWLRDLWTFICSEVTEANVSTCLEPLSAWPVFPTKSDKLVPPSLSKTVVFLDSFNDSDHRFEQVNVLQNLHLPEVKWQSMTQQEPLQRLSLDLNILLLNHLALPNKQTSITHVIQFMLEHGFEVGNLSVSHSTLLLEYFQEGCDMLEDDSCQCIKTLSIFVIHDDTTINLTRYDSCHTRAFDENEMVESDTWMPYKKCVFLKPRYNLKKIYEHLGITDITSADIYLRYILPSFHLLKPEARVKHLKNVQDNVLGTASKEERRDIIHSLTDIPCIPDKDREGCFLTAACFYDPSVTIFSKCVSPSKLLPESMKEVEKLLKEIGLVHKVTQEMFIEFAKNVETKARGISEKEDLKALQVISELLITLIGDSLSGYSRDFIVDGEFLLKISNIQFIASFEIDKQYVEIYPTFPGTGIQNKFRRPFICFRQAVPYRHKKCVWSTAMLLPPYAEVSNVKMCHCERKCKCDNKHGCCSCKNKGKCQNGEMCSCEKKCRCKNEECKCEERCNCKNGQPCHSREKKCECKTSHDYLGIVDDVLELVLSHAQNVVDKVSENDDEKKRRVKTAHDVCKSILKFLEQFLKTEENEWKKQNKNGQQAEFFKSEKREEIQNCLQSVSICPVEEGHVFVRAEQLVFDMIEEHARSFHPYLYKTPRDLLEVENVLKLLGARQTCSLDQLAGVLSTLKARCGDNRLGPNELRVACLAVKDIFNLLHSKTRDQLSVSVLYLPSTTLILRNSTDLLYATPNLRDHFKGKSTDIEFLIQLSKCELAMFDEVRLIELLPVKYRPKNFGEQMQEKPWETNKDCLAGQNCEYLEHIKRILSSEELTRVLLRLVRHQMEGVTPPDSTIDKIKALQNFSNLSCKVQLHTGWYNANGILEIAQSHTSQAFFEKGTKTIHLEHRDLPSMHHTSHTFKQVADSCNLLLGDLLDPTHASYLQSALDSKHLSDMNKKLSESNIPEYEEGDIAREDTWEEHYKLGTIVPSDIRHFLDQDPYNRFSQDEIVGYERNIAYDTTTEIIFARIVEEIDQSEGETSLSRKFKIDIGEDKNLIVSVIALYKFLTPKEPEPNLSTVPYTGECGPEAPSAPEEPETLPTYADATLEEIMKKDREQIRQEVEEAFNLEEGDRKKVVRRLFLRWHPDKNRGQEERTTEAFKFLQAEIKRRESGSNFSENFPTWASEARRDGEYQRDYFRRWYGHGRRRPRRNRSRGTFVPPSFSRDRPDPRKARLWFRQAEEHFENAQQTNRLVPGHIQWVVFQAHQAAEVALKAAQFGLNGEADLVTHELVSLAGAIRCESSQLVDKASELETLHCQFNKPRYPQFSRTSREVYEGINAVDVLKVCEELLNIVRTIIGVRV